MNQQIRSLRESDIHGVAEAHCRIFPTSRSTLLGEGYVRKMFQWFLEKQPDLSFVCEYNGEIVGYVVGAIGGYGRKLFRYAFMDVVLGLLLHPKLWFKRDTYNLWSSYLKGLSPSTLIAERNVDAERTMGSRANRAALAGIGIVPSMRGRGISKLLVQAFEQAARVQGVSSLGLSVEIDNVPARRLYETCGWRMDSMQAELNSAHYSKELS